MADPVSPATESFGRKAVDLIETGGKNAVKAVVQSVVDDGKNLVGKDVSLGTRVEAGLNLAADVSSVVVGPEDAAAERATVFAVKEGVEHAPQIAEGIEVAAKAAIEKAPEIEKAVVSGFERTKTLLKKGAHKLEDLRPSEGILETKNALYKVVERGVHDVNEVRSTVADAGKEAYDKGKNFAVHAEGVETAVVDGIKKIGQETYHEAKNLKATISTSEMQIEKSIETAEHSKAIERAEHVLDKGKAVFKEISEPIEDTKKIIEAVRKGVEFVGDHRKEAVSIASTVGAVAGIAAQKAHEIEHTVSEGAHSARHVAAQVEHGVAHVLSEVGKQSASAEKAIADDVKTWTPEMPFEQFGALMKKVRGVESKAASVSHDLSHVPEIASGKTPQKTPDLGHGH